MIKTEPDDEIQTDRQSEDKDNLRRPTLKKTRTFVKVDVENELGDYQKFVNPYQNEHKKKKCMIYQHSKFNHIWQILVALLLLFVCIIIPLHIAFNNNNRGWCITYYAIDSIFLIDLILQFFMTIHETTMKNENDERKKIAANYL